MPQESNPTAKPADTSQFTYDETSGYYYDYSTGLYYDAKTQYYYNSHTQQFLYWDPASSIYVPVTNAATVAAAAGVTPTENKPTEDEVKDTQAASKQQNAAKPAVKNAVQIAKVLLRLFISSHLAMLFLAL